MFGPQWQTVLGTELGVSRRQIVYWVTRRRPVSRKYSSRITQLVAARHRRRVDRERSRYRAMIASLDLQSARGLLLAMLAEEVSVRSEAIAFILQRAAAE